MPLSYKGHVLRTEVYVLQLNYILLLLNSKQNHVRNAQICRYVLLFTIKKLPFSYRCIVNQNGWFVAAVHKSNMRYYTEQKICDFHSEIPSSFMKRLQIKIKRL